MQFLELSPERKGRSPSQGALGLRKKTQILLQGVERAVREESSQRVSSLVQKVGDILAKVMTYEIKGRVGERGRKETNICLTLY